MKKAIIFDIDGTLADNKHRVHWLEGGKKDWDRFYSEMDKDTPNEPVVFICRAVCDFVCRLYGLEQAYIKVFICTGRPENYRKQTEEWLYNTLDWHKDTTTLIMRPAGDHRPDYQVKQEMLDKIKAKGYEILFTVDDRKQVVDMWRANGITCLQCAEGNF